MKKKILALLLMAALFCFAATPALASPREFTYIYPDSSDDYTFVFNVSGDSVSTSAINIIGMLPDYSEDELTAEEAVLLRWSIPNDDAAQFSNGQKTYTGNGPVITVTGRDEGITVTCYYDYDDDNVQDATEPSVPIFLVGETNADSSSSVSNITVIINGNTVPDVNYTGTIPIFDVGTVTGDDDTDVLNNNPSVIHAALYALEVANDDDDYVWGDAGWDWDYVTPANVTLISQGGYLSAVYNDSSANGYWLFEVNSADPGHAASAHQLHANDTITWTYHPYNP